MSTTSLCRVKTSLLSMLKDELDGPLTNKATQVSLIRPREALTNQLQGALILSNQDLWLLRKTTAILSNLLDYLMDSNRSSVILPKIKK